MARTIRSLAAAAAMSLVACGTQPPVESAPIETLDGNAAANTLGGPQHAVMPIDVTVLDDGGSPLAAARVVVSASYGRFALDCGVVGAEKVAEGVTDADGVCRLSARLSSDVTGVRAAACAGDLVGLSAWADEPGVDRTLLTVKTVAGVRPRGAVVDTHGRPVPGARVESWYGGGNLRVFRGATISADDGTFRLPPLPRAAADDLFVEALEPRIGSGGVTPARDDPLDAVRIVLTYPPPPGGDGPK